MHEPTEPHEQSEPTAEHALEALHEPEVIESEDFSSVIERLGYVESPELLERRADWVEALRTHAVNVQDQAIAYVDQAEVADAEHSEQLERAKAMLKDWFERDEATYDGPTQDEVVAEAAAGGFTETEQMRALRARITLGQVESAQIPVVEDAQRGKLSYFDLLDLREGALQADYQVGRVLSRTTVYNEAGRTDLYDQALLDARDDAYYAGQNEVVDHISNELNRLTREQAANGELGAGNTGESYARETIIGNVTVTLQQETTRGDGELELTTDTFTRDNVDFSQARDHIGIHQEGAVAGSHFNGELFTDGVQLTDFLKKLLPDEMRYDQYGRAELTLALERSDTEPIGYAAVQSVDTLRAQGVSVEQGMRMPGGEAATVDGVTGAWYPETTRDATGVVVIARDTAGAIKNPHGKFEPTANLATTENTSDLATNLVTIIIAKDSETSTPLVLTAFPGENAPAFPAKITTDAYSSDTLQGNAAEYWKTHVFIQPAQTT